MKQKTPAAPNSSMLMWETREAYVRSQIRNAMQACWRRNCRSSSGVASRSAGRASIEVRRPRARNLEERFESRVLTLFARQSREMSALLPELYLHGLSEGRLRAGAAGPSGRRRDAVAGIDRGAIARWAVCEPRKLLWRYLNRLIQKLSKLLRNLVPASTPGTEREPHRIRGKRLLVTIEREGDDHAWMYRASQKFERKG